MRYLCDGYNLIHALGFLPAHSVTPYQLERARLRLLERVRQLVPEHTQVTVVFDAKRADPTQKKLTNLTQHQDILVRFAVGSTADDLMEDIIRAEQNPSQLTVVSDDRRLKEAARRRGCHALGCLDWFDPPRPIQPTRPTVRDQRVTSDRSNREAQTEAEASEDKQRWLDAFGEIDHDPRYSDW